MAKLDQLPELAIVKGMKGTVDFYLWKGIPVARRWPRQQPRPLAPRQAETAAEFGAVSQSYAFTGPDERLALDGMVSGSQQRSMDMFLRLAYGNALTELNTPVRMSTPENRVLTFRIKTVPLDANQVNNVNNTAYQRQAAYAFLVPFSIITYTKFRIRMFGQSNQAGQTVTFEVENNDLGNVPLSASGNDMVASSPLTYYDSGERTIQSPPAIDTNCVLAFKGSNGTVDFAYRFIDVYFYQ